MRKALTIDPAVVRRLRDLQRSERADCLLALTELPEAFGRPHLHHGLGIRKLGKGLFECRAGLHLRMLFEIRQTELYIFFLGNHDEVQALLKRGTY